MRTSAKDEDRIRSLWFNMGMDSAKEAALQSLEQLRLDLSQAGAIGPLRRLVADVWAQNIDRYEPDTAGDTPRSLGQNCVENLKTVALWRYRQDQHQAVDDHWDIPGLRVEIIAGVLTMLFGSRRIVFMKAPPALGRRPAFDQFSNWAGQSEVRQEMASANTRALNGITSNDLEQLTFVDEPYDPSKIRHFILVWAGEEDSPITGAHLTVPVLGPRPFAAQLELFHDEEAQAPRRPNAVVPVGPDFDSRNVIAPAIALRPRRDLEGEA